jgi:hypothetical protein
MRPTITITNTVPMGPSLMSSSMDSNLYSSGSKPR